MTPVGHTRIIVYNMQSRTPARTNGFFTTDNPTPTTTRRATAVYNTGIVTYPSDTPIHDGPSHGRVALLLPRHRTQRHGEGFRVRARLAGGPPGSRLGVRGSGRRSRRHFRTAVFHSVLGGLHRHSRGRGCCCRHLCSICRVRVHGHHWRWCRCTDTAVVVNIAGYWAGGNGCTSGRKILGDAVATRRGMIVPDTVHGPTAGFVPRTREVAGATDIMGVVVGASSVATRTARAGSAVLTAIAPPTRSTAAPVRAPVTAVGAIIALTRTAALGVTALIVRRCRATPRGGFVRRVVTFQPVAATIAVLPRCHCVGFARYSLFCASRACFARGGGCAGCLSSSRRFVSLRTSAAFVFGFLAGSRSGVRGGCVGSSSTRGSTDAVALLLVGARDGNPGPGAARS